jgi:hypothetical protein
MLRSRLSTAAMAATSLVLIAVGCGGDDKNNNNVPPPPPPPGGIQPPAPGPEKACTGADVTSALSQIFLGDTHRDGKQDIQSAWKQYGFDIDGRISTKESTDLCKPYGMATKAMAYPDGNDGIDNSFGKNILPILLGPAPDISMLANAAITNGEFTVMLKMEGLGMETNCNPMNTLLYGGANRGAPPKWDGNDAWPVAVELLNNGDINAPKISFPKSYVVGNTWVSGTSGTVSLGLSFQGLTFTVNVNRAIIAVDLAEDHKSGMNGTIAGIIETEALVEEVKRVAGAFEPSLCDPNSPLLLSFLDGIRGASDIMLDGTQDPTKTCNGISIGLGFNGKVVQLGPVAPPAPEPVDPCLGTGGMGGMGGTGGMDGMGGMGGAGGAGGK